MQTAVYFTRFQSARGSLGSLPPFARSIVLFFALPGIVLLGLSILLAFVSIFVLLLLTVPVYAALRAVFGFRQPMADARVRENPFDPPFGQMFGGGEPMDPPGRKQVDAKVIDAD